MARPQLTLFLDIVSPFAYMAYYITKHSPTFRGVDITYIPIFLGGVMKACGNTAPLNIKNKDKWIEVERRRWAKQFNIPMAEKTPDPFPQLTVGVMRAICATTMLYPSKVEDCFSALYQAFWVERQTIKDAAVYGAVFQKVLGEAKAKEVMEKSQSPEAKKLLQDNSDLAFAEGAFGLPWFVATNAKGEREGFWGFDHMGQVADHLGLKRGQEFRAML